MNQGPNWPNIPTTLGQPPTADPMPQMRRPMSGSSDQRGPTVNGIDISSIVERALQNTLIHGNTI